MTDLEAVAKTLYGEARGEGLTGMLAVACVIRNRAKHPTVRWWGTGWQGVCLAPWQFSCWNKGDPNRSLLLQLDLGDARLAVSIAAAKAVMLEEFPDITNGADHYCRDYSRPTWRDERKLVATIGRHCLFRLEVPSAS